jgi:hypothetical protein
MTGTITNTHIEQGILSEDSVHQFSAFASELKATIPGFNPDSWDWPTELSTTLGNKQPFVIILRKVNGSDFEYATYRQDMGCLILKVFND